MERLRVPGFVDDASLPQYLAGRSSLRRIRAMAEASMEGLHLILPSCSRAALPHLENALPSFVVLPVLSAKETTFHIFRKHHYLCEGIKPGALLHSEMFARLIEKYLNTFGRGAYVRDQVDEQDWQRHLCKVGERLTQELAVQGGRLSLEEMGPLLSGLCGELLLEVAMQLFEQTTRSEGIGGFQLLRGTKGECLDTDHTRLGIRVRADSWLYFTSTYNCELWTNDGSRTRRETEIDVLAVAKHGSRRTLYLLDATTAPTIPPTKLHKHLLLTEHLDPHPTRSVETIIVSFMEEKIVDRPRDPNLRIVTLPLRKVVGQLQQVTLDTMMKQDAFREVAQRLREQMG